MFTKKEVSTIALVIILMSLILSLRSMITSPIAVIDFLVFLCISIIIIMVSVFSKKITARAIDTKLEIKIWELKRYGISRSSEWKTAVPMGILIPALLGIISLGFIKFMTFMQFEIKGTPARAAKKYGYRRFEGIMEWDDALIVFYSTLALLILAIVSKFLLPNTNAFFDLSKYSLYYAAYNLIPFSKLDGTRLFMGSWHLYVFTIIITALISLIIFL